MKIGINAFCFKHPAAGLGQYLIHLTNALAELDQRNEYILLGPEPALPKGFRHPDLYAVRTLPSWARRSASAEQMVWDQLAGPAAARKSGADIFHVPHFAVPLVPRTPTVVTVHDVIPLRLPLYRASTRVRAYMRLVAHTVNKASLIITVSNHAKQDIIDALKLPPDRIRVIYEAAGEECRPISDSRALAEVRARYGLGERYIFYLGGLDQRKNVTQLVRAFAHLYPRLGSPELQLLIAGDPDRQKGALYPDPRVTAAKTGVAGQVVCRFVAEEDKPALYSGTEAFVFPSLYEGFGLPPLEAMACGAPVICSNRTSLPEVVGDAAISLNPNDMQSLVDGMYAVLTNTALRSELRSRSLKRASLFNWRRTAMDTLAVYEEIFARSSV